MSEARAALVIAVSWAIVFGVGLYGGLRGVQAVLYPEANPATIIYSPHAGYFWRIWIVSYASVLFGFAAFLFARGRPELAARALPAGVLIAGALLVAQAMLVP
jgi:hypothetical protein